MEMGSPDPLAVPHYMAAESSCNALVRSDDFDFHASQDPFINSGQANKRKATCEPEPEVRNTNTTRPNNQNCNFDSAEECIHGARDLLIKAASHEQTRSKQTKILDLLNVFREFMENDGTTHRTNTILTAQVQRLEQTAQILQTSIQRSNAANTNARNMENNVPPQIPENTRPGAGPGGRQTQNQRNQGGHQAPRTWANVASNSRGQQNQAEGDWIQVQPRKKKEPAKPVDTKRAILIQDETTRTNFSALAFRDRMNLAFKNRGVQGPVVALVSKTRKDNIAVVTTPTYTAEYLIQNRDIWRNAVPHVEVLKDEPWYKVMIHGIPTIDFPDSSDLSEIKDEIETFNQGLRVVGQPYWITSEERRQDQLAGSIVVAFETEAEARQATSKRMIIAGLSLKVEKFQNIPATTQCNKCQKFGHMEANCRWEAACRYCAGPHNTRQHCCMQCRSIGIKCAHLVPKCSNCSGAHSADFEGCETKFSILTRHQSMDNSEETL